MKHTAQEVAETIIADILREPEWQQARSFSELHDFCDANVIGNQEQVLYDSGWTGDDDANDEKALASITDMLNEAQDIVDRWLKARYEERKAAGHTAPPERGGCVLINGRWWPKDSAVARNHK